jgi:hypothetical protein
MTAPSTCDAHGPWRRRRERIFAKWIAIFLKRAAREKDFQLHFSKKRAARENEPRIG